METSGRKRGEEGRFPEDKDIVLVRDRRRKETRHSCFIGPSRPYARPGRSWKRKWQRTEKHRVCEEEAKNEDEVNEIHGGYRILPARSRLRPPCLLLSLLLVSFSHISWLSAASRSRQPRVSFSEASYTSFVPRRRRRCTHTHTHTHIHTDMHTYLSCMSCIM